MLWTKNDYLTPPAFLERLNVFAPEKGELPIGLDPCSNPRSPVPARLSIMQGARWEPEQKLWDSLDLNLWEHSERQYQWGNGLEVSWDGHGLVFCNPPYAKIEPWAEKAAQEGDEVIQLLPNFTSSGWFHKWASKADEVLLWRGRMRFIDPATQLPCVAPRYGNLVTYWGERSELFLEAFAGCGVCFRITELC
jgi:hypothetical protein